MLIVVYITDKAIGTERYLLKFLDRFKCSKSLLSGFMHLGNISSIYILAGLPKSFKDLSFFRIPHNYLYGTLSLTSYLATCNVTAFSDVACSLYTSLKIQTKTILRSYIASPVFFPLTSGLYVAIYNYFF